MSTISDTINATEGIGILILLYLLYQAAKSTKSLFDSAGFSAQVTGVAPWVATADPLTPAHADSLAKFIGVNAHGGGYTLSPDKTQVWFFDGSFFDNRTGHYFNAQGIDQGDLLGAPGSETGTPLDGIDTTQMDAGMMAGFSA